MHTSSALLTILTLFPSTLTTNTPHQQHLFNNPTTPHPYKIPTPHDSAILARRILNLSTIATLSTVFPPSSSPNQDLASDSQGPQLPLLSSPQDLNLASSPIGLMDYYASCPPIPSSPTILAISIATSFRNTHQGSNISLSLRWHPPSSAPPSSDPYTYSPANMPRFSLIGYIEPIPDNEIEEHGVERCFMKRHPDAEAWKPGNAIHESWWARLKVEGIYWFGGFGDRAYIGWISREEWEGVKNEEIEVARLVGEEGYEGFLRREEDAAEELY